jgi:TP901 family phage tail tape measure protein
MPVQNIDQVLQKIRQLGEALRLSEAEVNRYVEAYKKLNQAAATLTEVDVNVKKIAQTLGGLSKVQVFNTENAAQYLQYLKQIELAAGKIEQRTAGRGQTFDPNNLGYRQTGQQIPESVAESVQQTTEQVKNSWQSLGQFLSSNNPFLNAAQATERARVALEQYGLTAKDVRVTADPSSGIQMMTAVAADAEGNVKSLSLRMDELGRITSVTSDRFSGFGAKLVRSVTQFTRWTIAAALIYKPLQLLGQQTELLVKNQTELANISIILGDSQTQLSGAFDAVANAARITGESIDGVIEGYTQALRATGNMESEYERFTTANKLLTDSLVLSKLSTFNQAQAMDTLVASLSQAGIPLAEGEQLLDRWVAVTKIANVDLRTLAESYAIVGSVAQSAGVGIRDSGDEINELVGIIAVLAEQTQLTATETGNALRATLTGISTAAAQDELRSFGIAVSDVNGQIRPFLDIAGEIATKFDQGLIDESQLSAISRAIGGGTRRQAQVEIVLKSLTRAQQINKQSAENSGAAYDALSTQVDTLQSAITNLGNAFQQLAQTWGSDGGLLTLAETTVKILTGLVDILDNLSDAVGNNLPALLAIGGLGVYGATQGRGIFGGLGAPGIGPMYGPMTQQQMLQQQSLRGSRMFGYGQAVGGALRNPTAQAAGLGGLLVGSAAATNFFDEDEGRKIEGVANIAGGLIGAAIGSSLAGPPGITAGAVIGSSIAEAFVSGLALNENIINAIITGDFFEPEDDTTQTEEERSKLFADEVAQAIGAYFTGGRGGEGLQQFLGGLYTSTTAFFGQTAGFFGAEATSGVRQQYSEVDWSDPNVREQIAIATFGSIEGGMERLQERFGELAPTAGQEQTQNFENAFTSAFGKALDRIQSGLLASTTDLATTGELSGRQISRRRQNIAGLDALFAELYATNQVTGEGIGFSPAEMEEAARTFISATDEQRDSINAMSATIQEYREAMETLKASTETTIVLSDGLEVSFAQLEQMTNQLAGAQADYLDQVRVQQKFDAYQTPSIVSARTGALSQAQLVDIIGRAQTYERKYETGIFGGDEELIQQYRKGINDVVFEFETGILLPISEMARELYGLPASARSFRKALEDAFEEGIVAQADRNFGFTDLPFEAGSAQAQQFFTLYQQQLSELEKLGYVENLEDTIVTYSNKQIEAMQVDNTIIQLLLGQIEDNTEEMVDGIYNLPSDGTFYVPFTGYQAGFVNAGGIDVGALADAIYRAIGGPLEEIASNTSGIGSITERRLEFGYTQQVPGLTAVTPGALPQGIQQPALAGAGVAGIPGIGFTGVSDFYKNLSNNLSGALQNNFEEFLPGFALPQDQPFSEFLESNKFGEGGERFNKTGLEESASVLSEVLSSNFGSMLESFENQPVEVTVDITANFETFLDGELVATMTKAYLAEELVRKGAAQGATVVSVI